MHESKSVWLLIMNEYCCFIIKENYVLTCQTPCVFPPSFTRWWQCVYKLCFSKHNICSTIQHKMSCGNCYWIQYLITSNIRWISFTNKCQHIHQLSNKTILLYYEMYNMFKKPLCIYKSNKLSKYSPHTNKINAMNK